MRTHHLLLGAAIAVSLTACGSAEPTPLSTLTSPADAGSTHAWLMADATWPADPLRVDVPADRLDHPGTADDPRYRVGSVEALDHRIELDAVSPDALLAGQIVEAPHGTVKALGQGFVYTTTIQAPGASGVRLHVDDLYLPRHAELWLFDSDERAEGPFIGRGPDGDGELWTPLFAGDQLHAQIRYTGSDAEQVLDGLHLTLADVGVVGSRFPLTNPPPTAQAEAATCGFNNWCVENAADLLLPPAVSTARNAVALMLYTSGRWQYICSGGLLEDTADSGAPYFLTANHCISRGKEARSLETFFQYATDDGDTCSFPSPGHVPGTSGSQILATSSSSDYTLLQLRNHPGGTTDELAWTTAPVANTGGTALYRISHPSGAPQSYSEHSVDTAGVTCGTLPRGNFIYSTDIVGATEGGSSGSPVVNAAGEVVGQLYGACGYNTDDECDAVNNHTVDGAFAAYASAVMPYLDSQPPSCTPVAEDCSNGIDDDCDGAIDAADSDCNTGGTCDLGQPGDSCSADTECCSNKCKGRRGAQTCN